MSFRRFLLRSLAFACALAVVLAALALAPIVQTWVAQTVLARRPALQGSLGWVAARFGKIEVSDLHLNLDGALLTIPALEARLPLTTAVVRRRILVRRLVAKGWKLDFSRLPGNPPATSATGSGSAPASAPPATAGELAGAAARAWLGALNRWRLPWPVTLDGVDLEGDVVVATPGGGLPAPFHLVIKGGGMAVGSEGRFTVVMTGDLLDSKDNVISVSGRSQLTVAMDTPRTFSRVELKTDLTVEGGYFPNGAQLMVAASDAAGADGEAYTLDVARNDRHLVTLAARYHETSDRLDGTWNVDLKDSDVALVAPALTLPGFAATGAGIYDTDPEFTATRAQGRLKAKLNGLEKLSPVLAPVGSATVDAEFGLMRNGNMLRIERLDVAAAKGGAGIVVKALQPSDLDTLTGALEPARPTDDWLGVAIHGVPPEWLAGTSGEFTWAGGSLGGKFALQKTQGGYAVRSIAPVTVQGVSVARAGRTLGRNLDLAAPVTVKTGPEGWRMEAPSGSVSSGGDRLADYKLAVSRLASAGQAVVVTGSWSADLQAPTLRAAFPALRSIGGRSASGEFSATLGPMVEWTAKLAAVGRDEHRSLNTTVHATVDEGGRFSFEAPVKVADGTGVSDLTVEGTVIPGDADTAVYLKLNGKTADLDNLRALAGSVAAIEGIPLAAVIAGGGGATGRDPSPFWGAWSGRILATFDRLTARGETFDHLGCAFQIGPRSIRLEEGRGSVDGHRLDQVEGALSFDPAAEVPYELKASATVEPFEVGSYFPSAHPDGPPVIEGQFSVAGSVAGRGINWGDLARRTRGTLHFESKAGIVRVFKTDVDEAIPPDTESAVSDTMGRMGTAFGKFFGVQDADRSARKKVKPALQAVLDVINSMSEIGYDRVTLTAEQGPDRIVHLNDLVVVAGDERVTGSGQITCPSGLSLRASPLDLELQVEARGHAAKLLSAAGLLGTPKDDQGFQLLRQPVTLTGTMEHLDNRQWHELLVKAAGGPAKTQSQ